jgi:hypothetical protein
MRAMRAIMLVIMEREQAYRLSMKNIVSNVWTFDWEVLRGTYDADSEETRAMRSYDDGGRVRIDWYRNCILEFSTIFIVDREFIDDTYAFCGLISSRTSPVTRRSKELCLAMWCDHWMVRRFVPVWLSYIDGVLCFDYQNIDAIMGHKYKANDRMFVPLSDMLELESLVDDLGEYYFTDL